MKTDYPDLERLPNTNFWKHLLNWVWNKPRWLAEVLYKKYFLTSKLELQKKEIELVMLRYQVKDLELRLNVLNISNEADNIVNLSSERLDK